MHIQLPFIAAGFCTLAWMPPGLGSFGTQPRASNGTFAIPPWAGSLRCGSAITHQKQNQWWFIKIKNKMR